LPLAEPVIASGALRREPMSRLRSRVAERLLAAQHSAAMLTTFNEVNMQAVNELRQRYKAEIEVRHGVKLGYMSFFVRAVCQALAQFPVVNAAIDGNDIVWHDAADIGIAISSPRGLVVPILRAAQTLSSDAIERAIAEFGQRARDSKLTLDDLSGGTFSITNGGVFGSLLSTPILNPPQSAILGMHTIQERPIAENGQVVIRPMMYLALTYDHRLIDGRDAVQFLVAVKAALETPAALLIHA
jgi:2-oxoglutarate dehydrogenase E2 component (dihydrolipoamide succinyltransferase)